MPLRREVLERREDGDWPDPEGDIVEVLSASRGKLKLLTRVAETYYCGGETANGTSCEREVDGPDETCHQH